ncbi:hypothetical protein SH601_06740 [Gracilibacillus sp. S3-1-1]|uniref:Uncharacterized protein n=1 Tax=Gracilibacillus pellucidus TaxID=3095368 RepID=A0ACC6M462_9BACI|nr:hypothetical protein [Gracilibacillus sp. S3-1-1]MDX8045683.1 hypothetical protein [Gracilibacillus sp. S3-1-1]
MKPNNELGTELSAEALAWTMLSLENGMGIFHFIAGDKVPAFLYEKTLKNIFDSENNS